MLPLDCVHREATNTPAARKNVQEVLGAEKGVENEAKTAQDLNRIRHYFSGLYSKNRKEIKGHPQPLTEEERAFIQNFASEEIKDTKLASTHSSNLKSLIHTFKTCFLGLKDSNGVSCQWTMAHTALLAKEYEEILRFFSPRKMVNQVALRASAKQIKFYSPRDLRQFFSAEHLNALSVENDSGLKLNQEAWFRLLDFKKIRQICATNGNLKQAILKEMDRVACTRASLYTD